MNPNPISHPSSEALALEKSYRLNDIVKQREKTLSRLNLKAGEKVLDLGCGVGFLAHEMAKIVGESGLVICLDQNKEMIEHTKKRCKNMKQTSFYIGNVYDLPCEDNSLDAVSCTQVLLYVENISLVISEIKRVLKTGGRIIIVETDWRGVVISNSNNSLTKKIFSAWDKTVASPNLPVHLGPILKKNGFSKILVEAIPILNTEYNPNNFSHDIMKWITKNAHDSGVISKNEKTLWLNELEKHEKEGSYFFCVNRFLFSAFLKK